LPLSWVASRAPKKAVARVRSRNPEALVLVVVVILGHAVARVVLLLLRLRKAAALVPNLSRVMVDARVASVVGLAAVTMGVTMVIRKDTLTLPVVPSVRVPMVPMAILSVLMVLTLTARLVTRMVLSMVALSLQLKASRTCGATSRATAATRIRLLGSATTAPSARILISANPARLEVCIPVTTR